MLPNIEQLFITVGFLSELERETIEFLVLGQIPGTTLQISFELFLVGFLALLVLGISLKGFLIARQSIKTSTKQNNPELIAM